MKSQRLGKYWYTQYALEKGKLIVFLMPLSFFCYLDDSVGWIDVKTNRNLWQTREIIENENYLRGKGQ